MTLEITFLRHGRSQADDENLIEGRYDSPPTQVGRDQAPKLATRWNSEQKQFDTLMSSTLARASETARIIAASLNLLIELEPDRMEWDNAGGAGLSRS